MIDYSSTNSVAAKFAALKEMAAKKPVPRLNPVIFIHFSDKIQHFIDVNKYNSIITQLSYTKGSLIKDFPGTLIDVGSASDTISYIETDRLIKLFLEDKSFKEKDNNNFSNWLNKVRNETEIWKQNRTEIKAGRFIKRLMNLDDKQCEQFSDIYKSYNDSYNYEFKIVGGDDIIKFYNKSNYNVKNMSGSLNKSCMSYTDTDNTLLIKQGSPTFTDRLKFYALNPNCALLIMKTKNSDKIVGRALLWKLQTGDIYLDRVYVDKESDRILYIKYAKDNKFYSYNGVVPKSGTEVTSTNDINTLFGNFTRRISTPYLDSFTYDIRTNKIIKK